MPVSASFCSTTRWNQRGSVGVGLAEVGERDALADPGVDARLLLHARLRQLDVADHEVQHDADERDEEDRQEPRHRRGGLAMPGDEDQREHLDGEVGEERDRPDQVREGSCFHARPPGTGARPGAPAVE